MKNKDVLSDSPVLKLNRNSIIYVLDTGPRSGGAEALFQLRLDLENSGFKAFILFHSDNLSSMTMPEKFKKYITDRSNICTPKNVVDDENNCIIVPDSATSYLFNFKKMKKVIWWLSINFYDGAFRPSKRKPTLINKTKIIVDYLRYAEKNLKNFLRYHKCRYPISEVLNLSGSYYVYETLKSRYNIDSTLFIHSIGWDFLKKGKWSKEQDTAERENVVLYNPLKASRLMDKLLERKKFTYIPVKGYTPEQMIQLFRKSKLYVDFGPFPGPERLPKETSYNGAAVLVGKRNAAVNPYDVMIPEKYKLAPDISPEKAEKMIEYMLDNYENIYHDFDKFRNMVENMEPEYYRQIDKIFGKIQL